MVSCHDVERPSDDKPYDSAWIYDAAHQNIGVHDSHTGPCA